MKYIAIIAQKHQTGTLVYQGVIIYPGKERNIEHRLTNFVEFYLVNKN